MNKQRKHYTPEGRKRRSPFRGGEGTAEAAPPAGRVRKRCAPCHAGTAVGLLLADLFSSANLRTEKGNLGKKFLLL